MNIYQKYGVVIDGVCENWHQLTMIILGWTSVKTKQKKNSIGTSFFFNNFYFVPMKNESIGEELKSNVKTHQYMQKSACDLW